MDHDVFPYFAYLLYLTLPIRNYWIVSQVINQSVKSLCERQHSMIHSIICRTEIIGWVWWQTLTQAPIKSKKIKSKKIATSHTTNVDTKSTRYTILEFNAFFVKLIDVLHMNCSNFSNITFFKQVYVVFIALNGIPNIPILLRLVNPLSLNIDQQKNFNANIQID